MSSDPPPPPPTPPPPIFLLHLLLLTSGRLLPSCRPGSRFETPHKEVQRLESAHNAGAGGPRGGPEAGRRRARVGTLRNTLRILCEALLSSPLSKGRLRARSGRVLRARPPASGGSPTAATAATRAATAATRAPALFLPPGAAGEMRSLWARTKIAGVSSRSFSELPSSYSVLTGFPGAAIRGLCSKHAVDAFPPPACCSNVGSGGGAVGRFSAGGATVVQSLDVACAGACHAPGSGPLLPAWLTHVGKGRTFVPSAAPKRRVGPPDRRWEEEERPRRSTDGRTVDTVSLSTIIPRHTPILKYSRWFLRHIARQIALISHLHYI